MFQLEIKISYHDSAFNYQNGEADEMMLVLKSLADHQAEQTPDTDAEKAKFRVVYVPDDE